MIEKHPHDEMPKLKGRGIEVKHVIPALAATWKAAMNQSEPFHIEVMTLLECHVHITDLIDKDADAMFMERVDVKALQKTMSKFLSAFNGAASHCQASQNLLFNVTTKLHWLHHLTERALYLHPRRSCCLIDEDFVGEIKGICQRCTASTPLHKVPNAVLAKYRWGMTMRRRGPENLR